MSSKDLSNVVARFCDGTTQRFEGLSGYVGTFAGTGANANKQITTVWVKSGNNASGDGPGYGQRFDSGVSCEATKPAEAPKAPEAPVTPAPVDEPAEAPKAPEAPVTTVTPAPVDKPAEVLGIEVTPAPTAASPAAAQPTAAVAPLDEAAPSTVLGQTITRLAPRQDSASAVALRPLTADTLPHTGLEAEVLAYLAAMLMALGGTMTLVSRRRPAGITNA
jgi:LPXTG-motif cell wall-anchored protein